MSGPDVRGGFGPDSDDGDRDIAARLAGIDGARPLPAQLADELATILGARDPVGRLAVGATDDQGAVLPGDLRDRLEAGLTAGTDRRVAGGALPSGLRRRLVRALDPAAAGRSTMLRAAAVVVALLVISGGFAVATIAGNDDRRSTTDLAIEPGTDDGGAGGEGFDGLPEADDGTADESGADATEPATPTTTGVAAGTPTTTEPRRPGGGGPVPPPAGEGVLVAYASCDDLLGRTKASALEVVGPYGLSSGPVYASGPDEATADGRAESNTAAATPAPDGGPAASTTNVQEPGVDEPDIVKSDGRRIVTLVGNQVRVSRDDNGKLVAVGSLTLPEGAWAGELLVDGDRALVLGATYADAPEPQPQPEPRPSGDVAESSMPYRPPQATVWTISLHDPASMKIEATLVLDGTIAAARLADGRVRIALTTTTTGPDWVYPTDGSKEAMDRATAENRRLVEESTLDDWSPRYRLLRGTDASTARTGRLCACDDTLRPEDAFAGASTMSVLTLDPQRPDQPPLGSAAVQGWAETVYASRTSLFVTTRQFTGRFDATIPTAVHRFDISAPDRASYRGSGEVRGVPLNQFSLSERRGHLRIATTDAAGGNESFVTVLAVREDRLDPVGVVGGLGKGERIFAVRFLDDVGYVVTFRQTDPLYTVDLTDPTKPVVRGELKIPGFSAYLHPVAEGRLLGVGQDATETGRATGAQLSSFDVRDVAQPREVARVSFGERSYSEVQNDHHAFLFWAPARRAMLPVQRYETSGRMTSWLSVVNVHDDGGIAEAGRVTHDGRPGSSGSASPIRRSFVVGDVLYTLSTGGILANDLGSLAERSWLAF